MVEYDPSGVEKEKECNSCSVNGFHCIGCDTLDEIVISRIKVDRTDTSDEVIRGLVEALEEARVSLGEKYGFDKAPVKVQIQFRNIGKALAQARKQLGDQSEK